jgi:hypothetical protein
VDIPVKPKTPPAKRPPKKGGSAADEREAAALGKIAKNFRRLRVAEKRQGPQFLMVLLALLCAALVLYKIFGPELIQSDSLVISDVTDTSAAETAVVDGPIDPYAFRAAIEAFEGPLLGAVASPGLDSSADTIQVAGGKLAAELQLDTRYSGSKRAAAALEAALGRLAAKKPPTLEHLGQLRQEWLALRRSEFRGADFFGAAAGSPAGDPLAIAAYRDQASALDQALDEAFDRAAALSREPEPGEETPEDKARRLAAIDDLARDLRQKLEGLQATQPSRPSGPLDASLMVAVQGLEQAYAEARRLAGSAANLTPAGRGAFAGVELELNRIRTALDELGR